MADFSLNVIVLGDSGCGKTGLVARFLHKKFQTTYKPTTFHNEMSPLMHIVPSNGSKKGKIPVELALWDTPGSDELSSLRELSYPGKDIAIICFNIADPDSFERVKTKWVQEVRHFSPKTSIVLVGLKKDLRKNKAVLDHLKKAKNRHPISISEGELLAQSIGSKFYKECSSRSGKGVADVFDAIARMALAST